jgi:hypothetical protein
MSVEITRQFTLENSGVQWLEVYAHGVAIDLHFAVVVISAAGIRNRDIGSPSAGTAVAHLLARRENILLLSCDETNTLMFWAKDRIDRVRAKNRALTFGERTWVIFQSENSFGLRLC